MIEDTLFTGFNEFIGIQILEWEDGNAKLAIDLEPQHLNRSGTLHGGVIATILDAACGLVGCYCDTPGNVRKAVSLNLSTNFIAQTNTGRIIATASKSAGGYKIFFSDAQLHSEDGTLLASAHGTYRYRKGSETLSGQPA